MAEKNKATRIDKLSVVELELELGLLNTLELGRPEELELELGRPEELGLPVVRGDILDDPDEDPKPVPATFPRRLCGS